MLKSISDEEDYKDQRRRDDNYLIDNELEEELERCLNSIKTSNKINLNSSNFISTTHYSSVNKEIYILLTGVDHTKKGGDVYTLVTFNLETNSLKSKKKMNFVFDEDIAVGAKHPMVVEEVKMHPGNENQMCFYSAEYLAFIQDLRGETTQKEGKEEIINVKIIHTSGIARESPKKGNLKDNSYLKYKKFKFSNFDNIFGVLFNNNSFGLYSMKSKVSQAVINKITRGTETVMNFSFGANAEFGWTVYSVLFLDSAGGIHYACPIFPHEFTVSQSYLTKMTNFHRNFETKEDDHYNKVLLQNIGKSTTQELNKSTHLDQSLLMDDSLQVKSHDYLKNFNKNISLNSITTIDQRDPADLILLEEDPLPYESSGKEYLDILVLKVYPLTILRVGRRVSNSKGYNSNTSKFLFFIDVINCKEIITPIRKDPESKAAYLTHTVVLRTEVPRSLIPNLTGRILTNLGSDNLLYGKSFKNSRNPSIFISFLNELYEISFPYLKTISETYSFFTGKKDLKLSFKPKINEILSVDYSDSRTTFGFYGVEKIDNGFILLSVSGSENNNNFLVKEFKYSSEGESVYDEEDELYYSNTKKIFSNNSSSFNFRKLEENLRKVYSGSRVLNETELDTVNFEKLSQLANKVLSSSSSSVSQLLQMSKSNPIMYKQIVLDDEKLRKFNLYNLDEYLLMQIEGIAKVYETILSHQSAQGMEKTRVFSEIIDKIKIDHFPKLIKEIAEDRKKIMVKVGEIKKKKEVLDQKIKSMKNKFQSALHKNKNLLEKYSNIKGYFEDNYLTCQNLQKSSEEVKQELFKVLTETKLFKVVNYDLNPNVIEKTSLEKQKTWQGLLFSLYRKHNSTVEKLNSLIYKH